MSAIINSPPYLTPTLSGRIQDDVETPEYTMQRLWSEVLHLTPESIGEDGNFIRLGGDSFKAIQLVKAARYAGIFLTVADILSASSLSDLLAKGQNQGPTIISTESEPLSLLGGDQKAQDEIIQMAMNQCCLGRSMIEDIYPCTPFQESAMGFTMRKRSIFVARARYTLPDEIDIDRLQAAWNTTVESLPVLRTRIIQAGVKGAFQVVTRTVIPCQFANSLDDYLAKDQKTPMLRGNALLRLAIVRKNEGSTQNQMVLTVHHAICDRWSAPLILQKIQAAYLGERLVQQSYKSLVAHNLRTSNPAMDEYWKTQLGDFKGSLFPPLPSSNYLPCPLSTMQHRINLPCHPPAGITLASAIRLSWALVLSKYTNSLDVAFLALMTGRAAPVYEIESIVGPAATYTTLRCQLQSHIKVSEALTAMQQQSIDMIPFEHGALPRMRLMGPSASGYLRQSALSIQIPDQTLPELLGAQGQWVENKDSFLPRALTMSCYLNSESVGLISEFDNQILSEFEMEGVLDRFGRTLEKVLTRPDILVSEF